MENNIIDEKIYQDLISQASNEALEQANEIAKNNQVSITKVIYDDKNNFEINSVVKAKEKENNVILNKNYKIYIKVIDSEIENLSCTCDDYKKAIALVNI